MTETKAAPVVTDVVDARVDALERRIAEMETAHRERLAYAELKAEAVRAGMIDLDGLKMIDVSAVALGDDGQVKGAEALMRTMRRAKPWLFGLSSTSSTAAAPPAQPPEQKHATKMSHAEWQAARAELLRHR